MTRSRGDDGDLTHTGCRVVLVEDIQLVLDERGHRTSRHWLTARLEHQRGEIRRFSYVDHLHKQHQGRDHDLR
jgi:hypothetical protein